MRRVAVLSLLLVCSVLAPAPALADVSDDSRQRALTSTTLQSSHSLQSSNDADSVSVLQSDTESNESTASNDSLGVHVSSFLQSTSAETTGVVENEMWEANVNRTERSAAVTQRVESLDKQVSTLRSERQQLVRAYENGTVSRLRYRAQLARLNGQLNALSAATGSTERAANRLHTDAPGLSKVRTGIKKSRAQTPPMNWSNRSSKANGRPQDSTAPGERASERAQGNEARPEHPGNRPEDAGQRPDDAGERGKSEAEPRGGAEQNPGNGREDAPGREKSSRGNAGNDANRTPGEATETPTDE